MTTGFMKSMRKMVARVRSDESGQSIAEYVLILFIVVMIAMKVKGLLRTNLENLVNTTGQKMQEIGRED